MGRAANERGKKTVECWRNVGDGRPDGNPYMKSEHFCHQVYMQRSWSEVTRSGRRDEDERTKDGNESDSGRSALVYISKFCINDSYTNEKIPDCSFK